MSDSHAALQNRIGNGFKTHDQHGIKNNRKTLCYFNKW